MLSFLLRKHPRKISKENYKSQWMAYHQGSQSSRLHPTVNIVKQSAGFFLNLDIVVNALPMENRSLFLDARWSLPGLGLFPDEFIGCATVICRGFLVFCRANFWNSATREEKYFALGSLGRDKFSCRNICGEESEDESDENTEISIKYQ